MQYLPMTFTIGFETPVVHDVPPLFVLRSILGSNLRDICCIARRNLCPDCEHRSSCIYAQVFDTIHDKTSSAYEGRDRAPHPFLLSMANWSEPDSTSIEFTVVLLGNAIAYAPYVYGAFERGQSRGFGRYRIPYRIERVTSKGKPLFDAEGNLEYKDKCLAWSRTAGECESMHEDTLLLRFESPLRFKHQGSYCSKLSPQALFSCFQRRMETLCTLYGESIESASDTTQVAIASDRTYWKDYTHYSSRQRQKMFLGGVLGDLVLEGTFTRHELDLVSFCEAFHAGKNTSFGFGKLTAWKSH